MAGFEPTGTVASHPVFDVLGYAWGQCTAFVAESVGWLGGGAGLGNAANWLGNAAKQGYVTTAQPVVGSVAVFGTGLPGSGGAGHVALVTAVNGGNFNVSEANVQGLDTVSSGSYSTSDSNLLGFILPKGDTSLASPGLPASLTAFNLPGLNLPSSSIGTPVAPPGSIDLNPLDAIGAVISGIEGFLLRVLIGILAIVLIIKGLSVMAEASGHEVNVSLPSGRSTGGATEGIAEDAGEAAA